MSNRECSKYSLESSLYEFLLSIQCFDVQFEDIINSLLRKDVEKFQLGHCRTNLSLLNILINLYVLINKVYKIFYKLYYFKAHSLKHFEQEGLIINNIEYWRCIIVSNFMNSYC